MENQTEKTFNEILGFGKVLNIFCGIDDEGNNIVRKVHITPVPLRDLPKAEKLVNTFLSVQDELSRVNEVTSENDKVTPEERYDILSEKLYNAGSELIMLSSRKVHPDLDKEEIMSFFPLSAVAEAIDIILDINDFLLKYKQIVHKRINPGA
jgi:hypothetical protein